MAHGRSRSRALILVLAAMVAGVSGGPVLAQDRLPNNLVTSESLSTEQQELVNLYAQHWAKPLHGVAITPPASGEDPAAPAAVTDEQIVTARSRLTEPLIQPGATDGFRRFYVTTVAKHLQGALGNPNLVARLNTMILVSHLGMSRDVVTLIQAGLKDQSPAVRYWAVKAIRTPPAGTRSGGTGGADAGGTGGTGGAGAGGNGAAAALSPADRQALLTQLEKMLTTETAPEVLEQVFLAMVDLEASGNNALERVVVALNRRVAAHVGHPQMPYRAATSGMQTAYRRALFAQQNRGGMQPLVNQIAAAAAKYLFVLSAQAQGAELSPLLEADYVSMAKLCYTILDQVRESRNVNAAVPSQLQFRQDLVNRNWANIRLGAQQFRDMLTNAPFNLDPTAVTVTQ